ncbi:hypothetical protein ABFW14_28775, partial [Mycolicibacterium fortuitum]
MKAWQSLGPLLAAGVLLSGCQSNIEGTPATSPPSPTEPSFPTARPPPSRPAPYAHLTPPTDAQAAVS